LTELFERYISAINFGETSADDLFQSAVNVAAYSLLLVETNTGRPLDEVLEIFRQRLDEAIVENLHGHSD
jgi:hypothetical protein